MREGRALGLYLHAFARLCDKGQSDGKLSASPDSSCMPFRTLASPLLFALVLLMLSACGPAYVPREFAWMDEERAQRAIEDSLRRRLVVDSLVVEDSLRRVQYPQGSIRVMLDPATIILRDSGGVAAHVVQGQEDIRQAYAALFLNEFTAQLAEETGSEVRSATVPAELIGLGTALPDSGAVFEVDGTQPDYLVWVRSVETNRRCPDASVAVSGGRSQCIGVYADVVVWNNRDGWPMAYGKLRGADGYPFAPSRNTYAGAVTDLAATLAKHAPLPSTRQWNGSGTPPDVRN